MDIFVASFFQHFLFFIELQKESRQKEIWWFGMAALLTQLNENDDYKKFTSDRVIVFSSIFIRFDSSSLRCDVVWFRMPHREASQMTGKTVVLKSQVATDRSEVAISTCYGDGVPWAHAIRSPTKAQKKMLDFFLGMATNAMMGWRIRRLLFTGTTAMLMLTHWQRGQGTLNLFSRVRYGWAQIK